MIYKTQKKIQRLQEKAGVLLQNHRPSSSSGQRRTVGLTVAVAGARSSTGFSRGEEKGEELEGIARRRLPACETDGGGQNPAGVGARGGWRRS
jgi:hypothetical protein